LAEAAAAFAVVLGFPTAGPLVFRDVEPGFCRFILPFPDFLESILAS
jgi:hypothetical protein